MCFVPLVDDGVITKFYSIAPVSLAFWPPLSRNSLLLRVGFSCTGSVCWAFVVTPPPSLIALFLFCITCPVFTPSLSAFSLLIFCTPRSWINFCSPIAWTGDARPSCLRHCFEGLLQQLQLLSCSKQFMFSYIAPLLADIS